MADSTKKTAKISGDMNMSRWSDERYEESERIAAEIKANKPCEKPYPGRAPRLQKSAAQRAAGEKAAEQQVHAESVKYQPVISEPLKAEPSEYKQKGGMGPSRWDDNNYEESERIAAEIKANKPCEKPRPGRAPRLQKSAAQRAAGDKAAEQQVHAESVKYQPVISEPLKAEPSEYKQKGGMGPSRWDDNHYEESERIAAEMKANLLPDKPYPSRTPLLQNNATERAAKEQDTVVKLASANVKEISNNVEASVALQKPQDECDIPVEKKYGGITESRYAKPEQEYPRAGVQTSAAVYLPTIPLPASRDIHAHDGLSVSKVFGEPGKIGASIEDANTTFSTPSSENGRAAGVEESSQPPSENARAAGVEKSSQPPSENARAAGVEESSQPPSENARAAGVEESSQPPSENARAAGVEESSQPPCENGRAAGVEESSQPPSENARAAGVEESSQPPFENGRAAGVEKSSQPPSENARAAGVEESSQPPSENARAAGVEESSQPPSENARAAAVEEISQPLTAISDKPTTQSSQSSATKDPRRTSSLSISTMKSEKQSTARDPLNLQDGNDSELRNSETSNGGTSTTISICDGFKSNFKKDQESGAYQESIMHKESDLSDTQTNVYSAEARVETLSEKSLEDVTSKYEKVCEDLEEKNELLEKATTQARTWEASAKQLKRDLKKKTQAADDLQKKLDDSEALILEHSEDLEEKTKALREAESDIKGLKKDYRSEKNRADRAEKELSDLMTELEDQKGLTVQAKEETRLIREALRRLKTTFNEQEKTIAELNSGKEQQDYEMENLKQKMDNFAKRLAQTEATKQPSFTISELASEKIANEEPKVEQAGVRQHENAPSIWKKAFALVLLFIFHFNLVSTIITYGPGFYRHQQAWFKGSLQQPILVSVHITDNKSSWNHNASSSTGLPLPLEIIAAVSPTLSIDPEDITITVTKSAEEPIPIEIPFNDFYYKHSFALSKPQKMGISAIVASGLTWVAYHHGSTLLSYLR